MFVSFENTVKKWSSLKRALIKEFSKTVSSKQIHQQLSAARKKSDESYQSYVYRMLELASYADIETEAKILYIIEGMKIINLYYMEQLQSRSYVSGSVRDAAYCRMEKSER